MLSLESLAALHDAHREALKAPVAAFDLRGKRFDSSRGTHLMGVVNLSSDSWYRESVVLNTEAAVRRGKRLAVEGADLVDVGAESTILHAAHVDEAGQRSVLPPVVRELTQAGVLVSVETYHPTVTESCLKAGAAVLNLTGTRDNEAHFRLVAEHDAAVIICYVAGDHVRAVGDLNLANDHTETLRDYFARQIDLARSCGVTRIWIDPGMGFYYKNLQDSAARVRYQMRTFLETFRLRTLGWPTCHALPHAFEYFEEEVRSAEGFFAVLAMLGKTDLLRTHEVARVRGVVRTMEAGM
ncbi:MAG: dihydropteroate synthase [Candidatus Methylacidiphilales bacterium]|nr:dihydropteroate synthase [Candidatus Methylacidiphilales bacterium]